MDDRYDVVVIGGGPAGLSAALALGRARRSVLVVDGGQPRNAPAGQVHNYLGRDGTPPAELLSAGRQEVTSYGGALLAGDALTARVDAGGFTVEVAGGPSVRARRLLVTTGLVDELPAVPGVRELWGTDVLHCPYCHGWEVRDQGLGVLATSAMSVHQALMWRQWSEDVTYFQHTSPELDELEREQLAARGIRVVAGEVTALDTCDGRLRAVRLATGHTYDLSAVVVTPVFTARSGVLDSLGLVPVEQALGGHVYGTALPADPSSATTVPGVWIAGNITDLRAQAIISAAAGLNVAAAINADLTADDTRRAVEVRREEPFSAAAERELCEQVLGDRRHGI